MIDTHTPGGSCSILLPCVRSAETSQDEVACPSVSSPRKRARMDLSGARASASPRPGPPLPQHPTRVAAASMPRLPPLQQVRLAHRPVALIMYCFMQQLPHSIFPPCLFPRILQAALSLLPFLQFPSGAPRDHAGILNSTLAMAAGAALGSSGGATAASSALPSSASTAATLVANLQNSAPWDSLAMLVIPQQQQQRGNGSSKMMGCTSMIGNIPVVTAAGLAAAAAGLTGAKASGGAGVPAATLQL